MEANQGSQLIKNLEIVSNLSYAPRSAVEEFLNALVILDGVTKENTTTREKLNGTWEIKVELSERNVQKTYNLVETRMPRTYDLKDLVIDPSLIEKIFDVKIAYIITNDTDKLTEIDKLQMKAFSDNAYLPVDIGVHFSERITDIEGGRIDHTHLQEELKEILGPEAIQEEMDKRDIDEIHIYAKPAEKEEESEIVSPEVIASLKQQFRTQKFEKEKYEKEKNLREYVERMQEERRIKEEITIHRKERDSELNAYAAVTKERIEEERMREIIELEERIQQRNESYLERKLERSVEPLQRQEILESEFEEKDIIKKEVNAVTEKFEDEKIVERKQLDRDAMGEEAENEKEASRMNRNFDQTDVTSQALPMESIERNRLEEERQQREMMEQESRRLKEQVTKVNANSSKDVETMRNATTKVSDKLNVSTSNIQIDTATYKKEANLEESYMKITTTDFIVNRDISWYEANIIKYVCRHKECRGRVDIEKAINSVNQLIASKKGTNFHHNKPNESDVISTKEFIIKNQLPWVEGTIVKLVVESELNDNIKIFDEVKELLNAIIEHQYK